MGPARSRQHHGTIALSPSSRSLADTVALAGPRRKGWCGMWRQWIEDPEVLLRGWPDEPSDNADRDDGEAGADGNCEALAPAGQPPPVPAAFLILAVRARRCTGGTCR